MKRTEIKTDLNRPKKETGLASSSTGLTASTSIVVGSPEVMEVESCFSDCFGLSQERGLFGEGEGLSFSSDDMLRRGRKVTRRHPPDIQLPSIYFYSGRVKIRWRPGLSRRGRLRDEYLSIRFVVAAVTRKNAQKPTRHIILAPYRTITTHGSRTSRPAHIVIRVIRASHCVGKARDWLLFSVSGHGHELVDTPTSFTAVYACAPPYSHTSPDTQGKPFLIQL